MATALLQHAKRKFPLGRTVITANALNTLDPAEVQRGLSRHANGDWGEIFPEDASINDHDMEHGGRLLSAYGQGKQRFWIITEANRAVTTVLLPLDY
jgi:hypothetical protein